MLRIKEEEKVSQIVKLTKDGFRLLKKIQSLEELDIVRPRHGDVIFEALKLYEQAILSRGRKAK
jgi:hypothetical protein